MIEHSTMLTFWVRNGSNDYKVIYVELEGKRVMTYPRRGPSGINATRLNSQDLKGVSWIWDSEQGFAKFYL
jgi:hypothetical protein